MARFGAIVHSSLALQAAGGPCREECLPDLIPGLGVNSGETIQVRQVRRCDRDAIPRLARERRLSGKDGIGIESIA